MDLGYSVAQDGPGDWSVVDRSGRPSHCVPKGDLLLETDHVLP